SARLSTASSSVASAGASEPASDLAERERGRLSPITERSTLPAQKGPNASQTPGGVLDSEWPGKIGGNMFSVLRSGDGDRVRIVRPMSCVLLAVATAVGLLLGAPGAGANN